MTQIFVSIVEANCNSNRSITKDVFIPRPAPRSLPTNNKQVSRYPYVCDGCK